MFGMQSHGLLWHLGTIALEYISNRSSCHFLHYYLLFLFLICSTTLLILAVPLSLNLSITILHYPQVGTQIFSISILLSIIVNTLMN